MELAIALEDFPYLPRPFTFANWIIFNTMMRTGFMPFAFQIRCAEALLRKRDVLCIAGTGTGKTLTFVIPCFVCPETIVWIVSPLNFIENQQCAQFLEWGLRAVSVNASTITPQLLEDIKNGCYQVVISSPEAYHDSNTLRPALLSPALKDRSHITVFDEAHCIETWGGSFRKTYARCGDLRPLILLPENCPIIAATATASPLIKKVIKTALQMRKGYHFENLGNFRDNMTHTVFRMTGGQKSYSEVTKLLPETLAELKQTIIFVHDYRTAHAVAAAVRNFYQLLDKDARITAPVYHSLKGERSKRRIERGFQAGTARVLISTEALTMGANFPNVGTVINYLVPSSQTIWLQRAGRSGRKKGTWADVIIMATPHMLKDAALMCKDAGIDVSAELLDIKVEDDVESDAGDVPAEAALQETAIASAKGTKGRYHMSLGMAEYIVTERCLVDVLDREFSNPAHVPCYKIGGCYNCKRKRQYDEQQALLATEQVPKQEAVELDFRQYNAKAEGIKSQAQATIKQNERPAKDIQIFKKAIEDWRSDCYTRTLEEIDICLDAFMTNKELKRVAKFKVTSVESFDHPEVRWEGVLEWRQELLQVIKDLETSEARKEDEAQRVKAEKSRDKERERQERRREQERVAEEKRQMAAQKKALKDKKPPAATKIDGDGSFFHPVESSLRALSSHIASQPVASSSSSRANLPLNSQPFNALHAPPAAHISHRAQGRAVHTMLVSTSGRLIAPQTSVGPRSQVPPATQLYYAATLPVYNPVHSTSHYSPAGVSSLTAISTGPYRSTALAAPAPQNFTFVDNILHDPNGPTPPQFLSQPNPTRRRGRPPKSQAGPSNQ